MATPLLTDVQMIYLGGANLTQTNFSQYYNGSEIVVAGQIPDNNIEMFTAEVIAISVRSPLLYPPLQVHRSDHSILSCSLFSMFFYFF